MPPYRTSFHLLPRQRRTLISYLFTFTAVGSFVTVTALHLGLNVRWDRLANAWRPESERLLDVAYLPVT